MTKNQVSIMNLRIDELKNETIQLPEEVIETITKTLELIKSLDLTPIKFPEVKKTELL